MEFSLISKMAGHTVTNSSITWSDNTTPSTTGQPQCQRDTDNDLATIITFDIATILICTFSVVGNSLVLYVINKSPELVQPMNYFIFSLAISDLLQGTVYPVYTFAHHHSTLKDFFGELLFWTIYYELKFEWNIV